MNLFDLSFNEFLEYASDRRNKYITGAYGDGISVGRKLTNRQFKIMFDYCCKHKLNCLGRNCRISWKNNEFISSITSPLPTDEELKFLQKEMLFHEVWCMTEYAVRCGVNGALGYESAKAIYGLSLLKELREVA